ncbi:NADH-quinone oxidoreductase subunit N [Candidatus Bealeia paramacronuclearis]|uniref:NADH-quinone oxidoreductase subunit NuoN n=1 Tax=Candidatus Bealeia paramacronuclearis TaxID=1921001 RepID=UPI002C2D9250|nr:NADH-quinone oxidoreductase subunit N [Candidatus Bealeia paramacronuclearis]
MLDFYLPNFSLILPEIILAITALGLLLDGVMTGAEKGVAVRRTAHVAILSMIVAGVFLGASWQVDLRQVSFNGQFYLDNYVILTKILVLIGSSSALAMSLSNLQRSGIERFEFPILGLLATLGMMVMLSSNDLLPLFMGLELQGLSLYILAGLSRDRLSVSEAALKYFVLGALSTGLFLYGVSLIYGFAGTTNFDTLTAVFRFGAVDGVSIGVVIGLVFVIASLAFKVSTVPFHMWTPDVYQGAATPVTAFLASAPKIAALALFLRLMMDPFQLLFEQWQQILIVIAAGSMILGAFAALSQTDLKRLLAYSSIGQMGYAVMGIAAGTEEGARGVILYMIIYAAMIIGVFACILHLKSRSRQTFNDISDLSGLSQSHPKLAFVLSTFMFSMAGIPPLAGFFGKLYIFMSAIEAGLTWLAILGVLSSVVSAFYYLRIVKTIYFDALPETPLVMAGSGGAVAFENTIVLNGAFLFTLLFCVYPQGLLRIVQEAVVALMN